MADEEWRQVCRYLAIGRLALVTQPGTRVGVKHVVETDASQDSKGKHGLEYGTRQDSRKT